MCDSYGCCTSLIEEISVICKKYSNNKSYLIPILHDLQDNIGYISEEIMETIAEQVNTTVSQVHGVATFYSLFYTKPHGKYVIRLCDSPPCHIEGSKSIRQSISDQLNIKPGGTTEDNRFTLEIVSCMGLCGVAPAVMINDDVYGNLTPDMIPSILSKYKEEN